MAEDNHDEPGKLKGLHHIISLEEGTCTDRAARHFAATSFEQKPEIVYVSSFSEGEGLARENPGHILLAPYIHPIAHRLCVNTEWRVLDDYTFLLQNPPLYLARGNGGLKKCALLPVLQRLVTEKGMEFVDADNTQKAAAMAGSGECYWCVTNDEGLRNHGLIKVRTLEEVNNLWLPLVYTREC
jgi:hypothetical protein